MDFICGFAAGVFCAIAAIMYDRDYYVLGIVSDVAAVSMFVIYKCID